MKFSDILKAALFILGVAMLVVWLDGEEWAPLGGNFRVVDGDSIKHGDVRIRLSGIDAPEMEQTCIGNGKSISCGLLAKQHLSTLLAGKQIICSNEGNDKHGRQLATCKTNTDNPGSASDALVSAGLQASINAQMVHDGWALAYGDYKALEVLAAISKRGLWALKFDEPQQWRRENGLN